MLTEVNTENKQKPCDTRKLKQIFESNCVLRKHYLLVAVYYISRDLHVLSPSYIYTVFIGISAHGRLNFKGLFWITSAMGAYLGGRLIG